MNVQLGDEVKIEKSSGSKWPRWQWSSDPYKWIDTGYSGEYLSGTISVIDGTGFRVDISNGQYWVLPLHGNLSYREDIWDLPGFFDNISERIRKRKANGCSCGAWSMYGEDWEEHDSLCSYYDTHKRAKGEPKNNDGRYKCWACLRLLIIMGGYQICNNKECNWYQK